MVLFWFKQEETPDGLKTDLDKLSDDIREHLNAFGGNSPDSSKPFFVSQLAATYAKEKSEVKKPPAKATPTTSRKRKNPPSNTEPGPARKKQNSIM